MSGYGTFEIGQGVEDARLDAYQGERKLERLAHTWKLISRDMEVFWR